MDVTTIPNRPVFRAQEVCEIAGVQPYVLRSWEAEFPNLGVAKTPSAPRVYRRADVERVLRLKQLVFVDGLTLAGARRRLSEEGAISGGAADDPVSDGELAGVVAGQVRQQLHDVRRGLQWILGVLSGTEDGHAAFELRSEAPATPQVARRAAPKPPARRATTAAKAKKSSRKK